MRVLFHHLCRLLLFSFFALIFMNSLPIHAQTSENPMTSTPGDSMLSDSTGSTASADTTSAAGNIEVPSLGFNQNTLYKVYQLAAEIGQLTMLVFAIGIFLIIRQYLQLRVDVRNSHWVLTNIKSLKIDKVHQLNELDSFVAQLKSAHNVWSVSEGRKLKNLIKPNFTQIKNNFLSLLGKKVEVTSKEIAAKTTVFALFSKLYEVFKSSNNTDSFNSELSAYNQYLKDKFNPFLTRMTYLSDAAGALGLLGTVWGMFITFFQGTMEQSEIISGMGVALATTIVGLVVSMTLNPLTTIVSNNFDHHLEIIAKMANDFQLRLIQSGLSLAPSPKTVVSHPDTAGPAPVRPVMVEEPIPVRLQRPTVVHDVPSPTTRIPKTIEILSKQTQSARVNSVLSEPLRVMVKDQKDVGIDGITVAFAVDADSGALNGSQNIDYVQTENGGIAQTTWKLGTTTGSKSVRVQADGLDGKLIRFFAQVLPDEPNELAEVGGNFQVGRAGEELPNPLAVRIIDKFNNPVPGLAVNFKIEEGKARFRNSRGNETYIETNEKGIAEVFLVLGEERGSIKIVCKIKELNTKCAFQAFAQ
ncbi:MotA/TolQ/ExbB proton channel family protein [candidate division KSB1 bacterium]|nr:MotA/TolQ/ExbB proton channel family protein [candidate division KSB1 bacterium]